MKAYVQCSLAKYHSIKNSVSVIHLLLFPSNLESGDATLKPVAPGGAVLYPCLGIWGPPRV